MSRNLYVEQLELGARDIKDLEFDLKSRDSLEKYLIGLQHIYMNDSVFYKILQEIEKELPDLKVAGRPGMNGWTIFVLGGLRLNENCDFDKLGNIINNHLGVRGLLGLNDSITRKQFSLTTVKDNFRILSDDFWKRVNLIIVNEGHSLLGVEEKDIRARIDSFVLESNVHFPTDLSLLMDAMRKVVTLTGKHCILNKISGWREFKSYLGKIKKEYRRLSTTKKSNSKNPETIAKRNALIYELCNKYLAICVQFIEKTEGSIIEIGLSCGVTSLASVKEIKFYILHAHKMMEIVKRRILKNETIPHAEKIFSIFEEYTEWISKGKAGVKQELGLMVCVVEDRNGFILNHEVMVKKKDKDVAVTITEETKKLFPRLISVSFDRGFYSKENLENLEKLLPNNVGMNKKGRYSKVDKEREDTTSFKDAADKHSAIESCINGLEHTGLDRCPDRTLNGFKRYVAVSVVARNIFKIGAIKLASLQKLAS